MDLQKFFIERWEAELPAFRKVLAALPGDQLHYKPHERSTGAGDLAWQIAEEQRTLSDLLDTGVIDWQQREAPKTTEAIVAAWDDATENLRSRLASLDAAKADGPAKFIVGGHEAWTDKVGGMLWGFLFDMVHHRGQLSTYLRPMGGKVPAIYGPSADDQGA
jgi:uncharacterized damage-inducible protein DinB